MLRLSTNMVAAFKALAWKSDGCFLLWISRRYCQIVQLLVLIPSTFELRFQSSHCWDHLSMWYALAMQRCVFKIELALFAITSNKWFDFGIISIIKKRRKIGKLLMVYLLESRRTFYYSNENPNFLPPRYRKEQFDFSATHLIELLLPK